MALAPCWHHHCQQPPQQQEWDGGSQGRWHFAGILWAAAVLGSKARQMRSRLPLLPHRQAHTVLAVRGGCFGAIITPALREAPLSSFSPTCRCMYRPNHQVWLCFGKMFHLFFPAPDLHPLCPLGSTTSVPSATCPPHAGSVLMQYSMSSVGHAQLALELGIGVFFL